MKNYARNKIHWASFILIFSVIVVRGFSRIKYAELWAEDGTSFLVDAMVHGWSSLFISFGGYLHLFSRLMALFSVLITPFSLIPNTFAITSFLYMAYVFNFFAARDFRWIVPSHTVRILIGLLCTCCYGFEEFAGTLNNSHWFSLLFVGILGLRIPSGKLTTTQFLMLTISSLSEVSIAIFLPLYLFRIVWVLLRYRDVKIKAHRFVEFLVIICCVGIHRYTAESMYVGSILERANTLSEGLIPALKGAIGMEISTPFIGALMTTGLLNNNVKFYWFISSALTLFAMMQVYKLKFVKATSLILFALSGFLFFELVYLGRPEAQKTIFEWAAEQHWWNFRYSFPLHIIGLIFWSSIFGKSKKMILMFIAVALGQFSLPKYFFASPRSAVPLWSSYQSQLESAYLTGCPKQVYFPIVPVRWFLKYESSKLRKCSESTQINMALPLNS